MGRVMIQQNSMCPSSGSFFRCSIALYCTPGGMFEACSECIVLGLVSTVLL